MQMRLIMLEKCDSIMKQSSVFKDRNLTLNRIFKDCLNILHPPEQDQQDKMQMTQFSDHDETVIDPRYFTVQEEQSYMDQMGKPLNRRK